MAQTRFQQFLARGYQEHGQRFTPPEGDAFIDAYNKGDTYRIKVVTVLDKKTRWERWGYVGITTGWKPAFLLMKRFGQMGSSDTLSPAWDKVVDSKWWKPRRQRRSK